MATAPRTKRSGVKRPGSRTLLYAGGIALALVLAYVLYRRRSSSSASAANTSGNPGPDQSGAGANPAAPNGGSSSIPGQLPDALLTAPDSLQTQVQQTNASASSNQSATTSAGVASSSPSAPIYTGPSGPGNVGGTTTFPSYDVGIGPAPAPPTAIKPGLQM